MLKPNFILSITLIALLAVSCGPKKEQQSDTTAEVDEVEEVEEVQEANTPITITKVTDSPAYEESSLQMNTPAGASVPSGEIAFSFNVENYELGVQTADAETKGMANSGKGQHIHLIVDNGPYSAHYEPNFAKTLEDGHHVLLAFLSRSYHESVKNTNAFAVSQITVGDAEATEADLSAPHMFYSRPKGTYEGEGTKKLLLDFYLLNTTLAPDGNKVKATINGTEFMIDEWAPHYIEGLPLGEVTVKLELIDANGELVDSPFNPVERSVTLK